MMMAHADIDAIEQALVGLWSNFGHAHGGIFHEESDLIWAEAPVPQLPYNAVIRTKLGMDAEVRMKQVINRFRERAAQFLWLVHPTAQPDDLTERLVATGLSPVDCATGMSLDFAPQQP